MRWVALLLTGLLVAQGACADGPADALRESIRAAATLAQKNDLDGAAAALEPVIGSEYFAELDSAERHIALLLSGMLALDRKDPLTALDRFALSSRYAEADADDWAGRFTAAYWAQNWVDAGHSLVMLAKHWPQRLQDIDDGYVTGTAHELDTVTDADSRIELLEALFDADYNLANGHQPSHLWRDLSVALLAAGRTERARLAAARITYPLTLVSLRVDRRYADIVSALPQHFDIDRAIAEDREQAAADMRARPRSLEAVMGYTYALLGSGRATEVLRVAEEALARIARAAPDTAPYDDVEEYRPWIMNNRTIALQNLGRRDEALAQLERASTLDENGSTNVSQAINLASFYLALGRPQDAIDAMDRIDWARDMSGYGKMQMQGVRHDALRALGRKEEAAQALMYLRDHQRDDPDSYFYALLDEGDLDAASAQLVARLEDPYQRNDALLGVQRYLETPMTGIEREIERRRQAVLDRPGVREAIEKVGLRERFNIVR